MVNTSPFEVERFDRTHLKRYGTETTGSERIFETTWVDRIDRVQVVGERSFEPTDVTKCEVSPVDPVLIDLDGSTRLGVESLVRQDEDIRATGSSPRPYPSIAATTTLDSKGTVSQNSLEVVAPPIRIRQLTHVGAPEQQDSVCADLQKPDLRHASAQPQPPAAELMSAPLRSRSRDPPHSLQHGSLSSMRPDADLHSPVPHSASSCCSSLVQDSVFAAHSNVHIGSHTGHAQQRSEQRTLPAQSRDLLGGSLRGHELQQSVLRPAASPANRCVMDGHDRRKAPLHAKSTHCLPSERHQQASMQSSVPSPSAPLPRGVSSRHTSSAAAAKERVVISAHGVYVA